MDSSAFLQISYNAQTNHLKVMIDENSRGIMSSCINTDIDLPADWWKTVYIGVSASTGDLADNHDILEIQTYKGVDVLPAVNDEEMDLKAEKEKSSQLEKLLLNENIDVGKLNPKSYALFALVKELYDRQQIQLGQIKRELEHSMAGIIMSCYSWNSY